MQKKYNNFYIFYKSPKTFFITISTFLILAAWSFWDRIFLHNKWNHSDWATFLAGFSGFCGAFIALYGIKWQVTRGEKQKEKEIIKVILKYIEYTLKLNSNIVRGSNFIKNTYREFSYTLKSTAHQEEVFLFFNTLSELKTSDILILEFGEDIKKLDNFFNEYNIIKNKIQQNIDKRTLTIENLQLIKEQCNNTKKNDLLINIEKKVKDIVEISKIISNYSLIDKVILSESKLLQNEKKYESLLKKYQKSYATIENEEEKKLIIYSRIIVSDYLIPLRRKCIELLMSDYQSLKDNKFLDQTIKDLFTFIKMDQKIINFRVYKMKNEIENILKKIEIELKKYE